MVLCYVQKFRENYFKRCSIIRYFKIAIHSMKEPERSVRSVIKPFVLAFWKHVRDESVAHVMSEGVQNPLGFCAPARCQRQTFKAYHSVASPISEPMVASYD